MQKRKNEKIDILTSIELSVEHGGMEACNKC